MFKLVVLCAFLAAVVAEPSAIIAPLAYSSVIAPATTTITNQASSVIHPLPNQFYSRSIYQIPSLPVAHFIKKRSVGYLNSYIAPSYSSIISPAPLTTYAAAPLATTFAAAPLATTYTSPVYTAAAHLIKKRSAPFILPSTYIAPAYSAPLLTSTYTAAAPILSTPYVSTAPVALTHLIKKRSAPLALAAYAAPASFSHQSRVDIRQSPATVTSYAYSAPLTYASPVAFSHVL